MNLIEITDVADPRLDPYRDLKSEDVRRRGELFIAEGRLVVQRLLQSRYQTVSVLAEAKRLEWVHRLVRPETPVLVVPPTLIREVSGFNFHRGLLACGRREPFLSAETLLPPDDSDRISELNASNGSGLRRDDLALDPSRIALAAISINDQENLGSLIRTSAAFGIETFVINRQTVDPLCRRVLRVSMGTALRMRFIDSDDTLGWLIENERRGGWFTIATTLAPGAIPLSRVTQHPTYASRPKLLLMGNEGDGLPADVVSACTAAAVIPMAPGVDSLNVSVAGAIAIYELVRSGRWIGRSVDPRVPEHLRGKTVNTPPSSLALSPYSVSPTAFGIGKPQEGSRFSLDVTERGIVIGHLGGKDSKPCDIRCC